MEFLKWARQMVRRFALRGGAVYLKLALIGAAHLESQGRWPRALAILRSVSGLTPEIRDPEETMAYLRLRLDALEPEPAVIFFLQFNNLHIRAGEVALVAALHDLDLGLSGRSDPEVSVLHLKRRLEKIGPGLALTYSVLWASVLGLADRAAEELTVLESAFQIGKDDYPDREKLARALAVREGIDESLWKMGVPLLAASLLKATRRTESAAVAEVMLGLDEATSVEEIRSRAAGVVPGDREVAFWFLMISTVWLMDRDRGGEAAALLEADLGVTRGDYEDLNLLASKLRARTGTLVPPSVIYYLQVFLSLLCLDGRIAEALALLSADLGFEALDQIEPAQLGARFRERCQGLPRNVMGAYLSIAAFVFAGADLAYCAAVALEADPELDALAWNDPAVLAAGMNERLQGFYGSTRVSYLAAFVWALEHSGRNERAALLVDAALRGGCYSLWEGTSHPHMYAFLAEEWLRWWGRSAPHQPLVICAGLISTLRKLLMTHGVALRDRDIFVRRTSDLRRRIIETGLYWAARETSPARGDELRRTALLWDLELAQRLILERFLLTEIHPAPAGGPVPAGAWPLFELPPATASYLPDFLEVSAMTGLLEGMSSSQTPSPPEETSVGSPFASRFEDLAQQGLDEAGVAGSLGPNGLLLRVTFDPEGRLVWGALRGAGPRLDLAGFGAGEPGDLQRLRWAAARHDFSMGFLHWMTNPNIRKLPPLRSAAREALRAALEDLAESAEPGVRVAEVTKALSGRLPEKFSVSILRLFRVLTWPLAEKGSDPVAVQELKAAERFVAEIAQQPQGRDALDAMTADYLRHVAEIWNLSSLDDALTPDTDLVVQGDDALHAVPVAWLPRGGEPLYRRVRTARASLAPQLDALLEEIDRDGSAGPDKRRLLSISYFGREDPAREGARWLHHGHLRLAERFRGVSVAGADEKTGTVGSIRAALEQYQSFATAAICGHGDFEQAGIQLGGWGGETVLWQGQGCDLSRVDWLLLVSCSIGRASRTGDLDVEGFCVQLAVHRARSVLACRWPVLSVEAAAFANEAVRQYLELEGKPERRARALAAARQAVCEGEKPLVGLNTAAAFELYGLG